MTVATTLIKEELTGDGVTTTPFTFTFRLLTTDQLDVYVNDVLKTISTDYSVTIDSSGVGGYVTFVTAPAAGASIWLVRKTDVTQEVEPPVMGKMKSVVTENVYDKLTCILQEHKETLTRALTISILSSYAGSLTLPDPTALYLLRANAANTALEWVSAAQASLDSSATYTRLQHIVGYKAAYDHTLSNDTLTVLAVTDPNATATINVKAETGSTDNLSFFSSALIEDGMEMILRAYTGHTISVLHNQAPGGGQLPFISQSGNTLSMSGNKVLRVQRVGNFVYEMSSAGFATSDTLFLRLGGSNAVTSPRPLLNIPAAPTVTVVGATGATTRSYAITDGDPGGTETAVSANGTVANANGTLNGSNFCRITFPTVANRIYRVYRTVASGTPATTGLIATVTGTGGTVTVDDTNLVASTAAPTVHTWKGIYEMIGNYALDANVTGTEVRIYIVGDLNLGGSTYTYTGVAPYAGQTARLNLNGGMMGSGLSPGLRGTASEAADVNAPSGAGNGGAGGRGAAYVNNSSVNGAPASPIEAGLRGSSGATGGYYTTAAGNAGDAGGSLIIECYGGVTNCNVNLAGGAGTAGSGANDPGGSGGSGGGISVRAKTFNIIGVGVTHNLNGGAGGNGGTGGPARYGGGGGGAGKGDYTCEDADVQNSGSITNAGGAAGTSTSATIVAQAGSSGVVRIARQRLVRFAA